MVRIEIMGRLAPLLLLLAVGSMPVLASQPDGTLSVWNTGATGDGVTDDTDAIQTAIDLAQADPELIGVYLPPGHYRITNDISMRNGVSLFGDHQGLSVLHADRTSEHVVGNDVWGEPVNDFVVEDLHFVNAHLSFYGSQRKRYSISRCIFVATYAAAYDDFQARLDRSEDVVLADCIFLRQSGGFSSAFSSYKTTNIQYLRNIVGLDLGKLDWLRTEWIGHSAWHDVIGKLQTLQAYYALNDDQGWFRSGVKIHTDNNDVYIVDNIFNASPAAIGPQDHVMYIHNNDTGRIEVVSNWMRGWRTDSTGGLKIRNNDGPLNVVANHFVNTPILGYIHDNTPRVYNGTFVYRNRFTYDDFENWGPINYWNQLTGGNGTEAVNEFAENVFDCGGDTSWGSVWFRNVTNPGGFAVYRTNTFTDGTRIPITNIEVTHGRVTRNTGAPDPAKTAPYEDDAVPLLNIPAYTCRGERGDVDGDRIVSMNDLALVLERFRGCAGEPEYLPSADLNDDGCIDLADLAMVLAHYGQDCAS